MYPKIALAQLLIAACNQFKIDTVVISPGSRNAPLTIGFLNHPKIKTLSIVDERCAAFFALGIAQQTQKPVAIVCTSGSALLNYYPAIAEAFYSNIPLLVISADRPKHLIDIGDGQTIRQENVFANHILFSANLAENELKKNTELVSKAIQIAILKKGPVHINVPFNEPLYETVPKLQKIEFSSTEKVLENDSKIAIDNLTEIWNTSTKKMILVGVNFPDDNLQQLVNRFAEDTSVLILTETTSNLANPKFINAIDQLIFSLKDAEFKTLQPEILLTLGGMIISKKVKYFLRNYQPKHHWHIDPLTEMDTFYCLTEFIQQKPTLFFKNFLLKVSNVKSNYQQKWIRVKKRKQQKQQQFLQEIVHSDFTVFNQVLKSIPEHSNLQVSNSSIIRYTQLFTLKDTLRVFCNRGTSGIDGSTSTAIGAAYAKSNQTVFITGDISFFYDSNALWNTYIPKNFRIILINNSGGGIFKIISGPKETNAIEYFETPHCLTAEHLCKMYNLEYAKALTTKDVEKELKDFYLLTDKPKLLEIFTPSDTNDKILNDYFKYIT